MNKELEDLIVLQAQDLDLQTLRTEMEESPKRVRAAETALLAAQKNSQGLHDRLQAEEKLRRGQESDIGTQRSKLERLRRNLDSATSTTQVSALQHDIDFANTTIARLDDEAFASLERTETLEAERTTAKTTEDRLRTALEAERNRNSRVLVDTAERLAGLENQREALRAQVSPDRLAIYDRLRRSKGTALAEAVGTAREGKCGACQMAVRTQRWQNLIGKDHLDEIFTCESCGRMLFWDPRRDSPGSWTAGDKLRAAAGGSTR